MIKYNEIIWISILLLTIFLFKQTKNYKYLLLPIVFHILNDIMFYCLGYSIFNTREMVKNCYEDATYLIDNNHSNGIDLGFNLYQGDITKNREQAQEDKFKFMWNKLKLKKGSRLIDIGCGFGDWLNYAKNRGANVYGINISDAQGGVLKKRNIPHRVIDWSNLANTRDGFGLFKQFDCVTFMDTIEHYVPGNKRFDENFQDETYIKMFNFANNLLDDCGIGRVFISCLHQVKKLDLKRMVALWSLDRTMCGFYPIGKDGLIKNAVTWFDVENVWDVTEDYRITSVLESDHFGVSGISDFKWNISKLCYIIKSMVINPYFYHHLIVLYLNSWMVFYGDSHNRKKWSPEITDKESFVKDYFIVLQRRKCS